MALFALLFPNRDLDAVYDKPIRMKQLRSGCTGLHYFRNS